MVPSVGDLLTASDFTPHLLNDPHAPMVTVLIEEQALAPARVLARVPYLEHLLGLVQRGCEAHQLAAACAPAVERAHADLATYLAMLITGLFEHARLAALPEELADFRQLVDPTVVTRALLAQINYAADVAANMPPDTYTTGSGIFRFGWRARQRSSTIVLRLRMVYMYLPQPIASCLRSPPEGTKPPLLAPVTFPAAAPARCTTCMLVGSSRTRSLLRAPLSTGTWLGSALARASWRLARTYGLAHISLSIPRSLSCGPSFKSASRW